MKRLLFISPRFLFPVDSGGKIRTTQILRGMRGSEFEVTLMCPTRGTELAEHAAELDGICNRVESWQVKASESAVSKARHLFNSMPIPIRTDWNAKGSHMIAKAIDARPDVVVFDFLHSCVLAPKQIGVPSVLFTHNVESQIFSRHLDVASNPFKRWLWGSQYRKMHRYEAKQVPRFDVVVAVSPNDGSMLTNDFGAREVRCIPTSVDLDRYDYVAPTDDRHVIFIGSMDWLANQDGVQFFMDDVWPRIAEAVPDARMSVVGRSPPKGLEQKARARGFNWTFTGYVDDVRSHVNGAAVSIVPLRIGGGTRLKVFEAMAMGCPVVSTTIGVEGLAVADGKHYLCADTAEAFAERVVSLMLDGGLRMRVSREARSYVDTNFGIKVAARAFESACEDAIRLHGERG